MQLAYVAFTDSNGVALAERTYPLAGYGKTSFSSLAGLAGGEFYTVGYGIYQQVSGYMNFLTKFDSVGNVLWQRTYRPDSTNRQDFHIVAAPRGGYTAAYKIYSAARWHAQVTRFDERGRLRWVKRLGMFSHAYRMAALPDGAYAVASTDYTRVVAPSYTYRDASIKLYKLSPAGDSITSVWLNHSGYHDKALSLTPTRDGGLLVLGLGEEAATSVQPQALCIKLDSMWREQWRYTLNVAGAFFQAQELANGHFVLSGTSLPPYYLTELIPPTYATPADTLPTVAWALDRLPVLGSTMFCEANGSIRLMGGAVGLTPRGSDLGIAYFTGLTSAPVQADFCARPPVLTRAPTFGTLTGNTLTFTLDSVATRAGPRYGEVALVRWEFGDGTPADTGWVVRHAFASPQRVQVRVCVTNNLFCQTCATLAPFGPVGVEEQAVAGPGLAVYPNPASGAVRVRPGQAGAVELLDALGRVVRAGRAAAGQELTWDVADLPAGLYVVRAGGQTRRLVVGR